MALIHRRKAEIEKEIQQCRDRISALQAELPDLEVAARVLARLEDVTLFKAVDELADSVAIPPHAKPANIPTMPDMILKVLDMPAATLHGGLEPADIRDVIAKKWWPEVRPDVVGPIAWRMWKRGQLRKNGAKYLAPQKNEAADEKPRQGPSTASVSIPAQGREAGPGSGT
ncbi:MAG: NAD-glutamate dehydrogenase [Alphaproteobacteria bacterium]|nr:NAD-glutamate dehydrogenase [Alphaproteobacteria bacterium]